MCVNLKASECLMVKLDLKVMWSLAKKIRNDLGVMIDLEGFSIFMTQNLPVRPVNTLRS